MRQQEEGDCRGPNCDSDLTTTDVTGTILLAMGSVLGTEFPRVEMTWCPPQGACLLRGLCRQQWWSQQINASHGKGHGGQQAHSDSTKEVMHSITPDTWEVRTAGHLLGTGNDNDCEVAELDS